MEKYRQIILYKVVNLALNINIVTMNTIDYLIKIIIDYFSYCATFKCHATFKCPDIVKLSNVII